jgi:ligand-binding SRPBCC domain-containing protein
MPRIKIETRIKAERAIVFDLSCSIDLHKLSTQHTHEEAIAGVTSGLIGLNQTVTWKAKHFGIYQKLTSKITAFDRPNYFVDEMQKGIFKEFKHEHIFQEQKDETLMIDIFNYTAPFGILGRLADSLFLKKYMKNVLAKRNVVIKEFAETEKWKQLL